MSGVYYVSEAGKTETMKKVHCASEDAEIQALLENNLDLIPGDQIKPEDPRRWLMIRREMPVPDPVTGSDRWSIDFFIVDQDATPTFVECKRFADTRSRREVVGQMFEYAANGQYYWSAERIKEYAEQAALKSGKTLNEAICELCEDQKAGDEFVDNFFASIEKKLREAELRIIFFLEEAPVELRAVVDFINRQMAHLDVLLVEARQYELNKQRIVVPMLFGFTEDVRQMRRAAEAATPLKRKKWDEVAFSEQARERLGNQDADMLNQMLHKFKDIGFEINWGTGYDTGSYSIKAPDVCPRSFLSIFTNGSLTLNFGWLNGTNKVEMARDRFAALIKEKTPFDVRTDYVEKYPNYPKEIWIPHAETILDIMTQLIAESREEL